MTEEIPVQVFAHYASENSDWLKLLRCLDGGEKKEPNERVGQSLKYLDAHEANGLTESYRDFQQSVNGSGYKYHGAPDVWPFELYPSAAIGYYKDLSPEDYRAWAQMPTIDISPEEYFVYEYSLDSEIYQDSFFFDPGVLVTAIQVGHLSSDEKLLLVPDVVSQDGEWEAWLIGARIGALRFRSFAEMIQNLAFMIENDPESYPPYSKGELLSGCGQALYTAVNLSIKDKAQTLSRQ